MGEKGLLVKSRGKRLGVVLLGACLVAALAFGGALAFADLGSWWPDGSKNTLTVAASGTEEFAEDIAKADVVVDVIQIATATPNPNYQAFDWQMTGDFAGLTLPAKPTAADWEALAAQAAAIAEPTADGAAAAGQKVTGLADGLYLVVAHGRGITDGLTAYSDDYQYDFPPTIVALPDLAADGVTWVPEATIAMKAQRQPLYGSLRIEKRVPGFTGEPATFVFHVTGTTPSGKAYDNYALVYYAGGESAETVVTHIPANTKVTVTEEYDGSHFQLAEGESRDKPAVIVADAVVQAGRQAMASVTYVNEPTGSGKRGHGIENNFELIKKGEGESAWDWKWHATPESEAEEGSAPQQG